MLQLTWILSLRRPDTARWADFMYFSNFSKHTVYPKRTRESVVIVNSALNVIYIEENMFSGRSSCSGNNSGSALSKL